MAKGEANAIASHDLCLLTVRVVFLPIAQRELRVAARKRNTLWLRVVAAGSAFVIGAGFFILASLGSWFGIVATGRNLFTVITWLCLAAALAAGLFFTCDSLSEEKREGTLGFLFLTDLRGRDVVAGKLAAGGLRSLYGLLAVLPVLAITLFMGGVTGTGFFKTSLALLNALLVSLVAGLFVSSVSRDSHKSLAATVALLGLWVAAGPVVDGILAGLAGRTFKPLLSVSSPGYLFVLANRWGRTGFWWALLVNQMLVWTLVGLSGVFVRRTWQDKPIAITRANPKRMRRAVLRRKLVDLNPALWLACLDRSPAIALWVMTILVVVGVVAVFRGGLGMLWLVWTYVGGALSLIVYLFVASQAGRFFVESRRAGLLELLLATPLPAQQIVAGQWRGLLRMLGLPLGLFLAAQLIGGYMTQQQTWKMMAGAAAAPPAPPTATNAITTNVTMVVTFPPGVVRTGTPAGGPTPPVITPPHTLVIIALSVGTTVNALVNLAALVWFGMWMGLTSKNTSVSTLKTMFWVQIIPWFAVSFVAGALVSVLLIPSMVRKGPAAPAQAMVWFPFLSAGLGILLYIGKDIFFCVWSRRKLYSEFRTRAAAMISPHISAATIRGRGSR